MMHTISDNHLTKIWTWLVFDKLCTPTSHDT